MIKVLVIFILLLHIYLCQKRLAYGCALYIAVKLIMPTPARFGLSIYALMIVILVMFTLIKRYQWNGRYTDRAIALMPLKKLIIPIAFLGLFGIASYAHQYTSLFRNTITEFLPFTLLIIGIQDKEDLQLCLKTFVFSFIVIGIYGLYTYVSHSNILVQTFAVAFGSDEVMFVGDGSERLRGALLSSASGNQSQGAIPWGQISLVMLSFGLVYPKLLHRKLFVILAIANCFLSTKRSAIVPMIVVLLAYVYFYHGYLLKRYRMKILCVCCLLVAVFMLSPQAKQIYHANIETAIFFWNDKLADESDIRGSNKSMRLDQMKYVHKLVADQPLTGLGYDYPSLFNKKHQGATDAKFFESLYLSVVTSSGIIGFILWIFFFIKLSKLTKWGCINKQLNWAFHGGYFISIMLTNIYCSLAYYMVASALLIKSGVLELEEGNV